MVAESHQATGGRKIQLLLLSVLAVQKFSQNLLSVRNVGRKVTSLHQLRYLRGECVSVAMCLSLIPTSAGNVGAKGLKINSPHSGLGAL